MMLVKNIDVSLILVKYTCINAQCMFYKCLKKNVGKYDNKPFVYYIL